MEELSRSNDWNPHSRINASFPVNRLKNRSHVWHLCIKHQPFKCGVNPEFNNFAILFLSLSVNSDAISLLSNAPSVCNISRVSTREKTCLVYCNTTSVILAPDVSRWKQ